MVPPLHVVALASLLGCVACDHASTGNTTLQPTPAPATSATALRSEPALPTSSSTTPAPGDALLVVLSRQGLSLGRDGATLAVPDVDTAMWSRGFDGKYKQTSRNDYYLVPLGSALQAAYPGEASVPAVGIAADRAMSYRMLTETLYTLGQERVQTVSLLVGSSGGKAAIALTQPGRLGAHAPLSDGARLALQQLVTGGGDASAPRVSPRPAAASANAQPSELTLGLNVIVTGVGFVVSAAGQRIALGCHAAGGGVAVPKRGDAYDFAALTTCATAVKSSDARFAAETHVTVTADAKVDVQTLVSTIDALRGAGGSLCPDVSLGVPR